MRYLGIGPAAHSFDGGERHWNPSSVGRYIEGAAAENETLTERDRYNEYVMTRLRTVEGIDLREVAGRFGTERAARIPEAVRPWVERGTVVIRGERVSVPPRRMLLSDAVIETLFET